MGGSIDDNDDREDLESIQSEASDISEDFEDIMRPHNADPYGTTLRFRYSRRREIDHLGQSEVSLPPLRSGRL